MRAISGLTTVTLLLAAAASSTATAQPITGAAPKQPNRAALEQQVREQTAKVAQQKLELTDAQLGQLEQTNVRFAPQFNQLAVQERETRRQLRLEMTAGQQANQQHVSDLLDASLRFQKQRISLVEAEQRELAGFLTPVQRARYIALQAQFRNRAQELRQNGGQRQGLGQQRKRPGIARLK
jgi:periplasmic protein CpxP/Spy